MKRLNCKELNYLILGPKVSVSLSFAPELKNEKPAFVKSKSNLENETVNKIEILKPEIPVINNNQKDMLNKDNSDKKSFETLQKRREEKDQNIERDDEGGNNIPTEKLFQPIDDNVPKYKPAWKTKAPVIMEQFRKMADKEGPAIPGIQ